MLIHCAVFAFETKNIIFVGKGLTFEVAFHKYLKTESL